MDTADRRSSAEIRREIENTREEFHETVEAIERKLSPGRLLDDALNRVQGGDDLLSSISHVATRNPVPVALMGLGLAWLAVEQFVGHRTDDEGELDSEGRYSRRLGRVARRGRPRRPSTGDTLPPGSRPLPASTSASDEDDDGLVDRARDSASSAADAVRQGAQTVSDAASSGLESTQDWLGDTTTQVQEQLASATDKVAATARGASRGGIRLLDEQPLAMNALAFGLGLAAGVAVPTTSREDQLMGEAADAVKEEVGDIGRSVATVVVGAGQAARDDLRGRGVVDEVRHTANQALSEASREMKEGAERENLDKSGLKDRAADTRDRIATDVPEGDQSPPSSS